MQSKKILFLLLWSCGICCSAHAQMKTLIVSLRNGEKVSFDLKDLPKTTFTSRDLIIHSGTLEVTYPLESVQNYTYSDEVTGLTTVEAGQNISLQQEGNRLTFHHLSADEVIAVYGTDGRLVRQQRVKAGQPAVVSLDDLPTGVYLIQTRQTNFKVLKR